MTFDDYLDEFRKIYKGVITQKLKEFLKKCFSENISTKDALNKWVAQINNSLKTNSGSKLKLK